MADPATHPAIEAQLRLLARTLVVPEPGTDGIDAIMARLEGEPAPAAPSRWQRIRSWIGAVGGWMRARWRLTVAIGVAVLLTGFVASPAGAGVRAWLGFGGVVVVSDPAGEPAAGASSLPATLSGLPANATEVPLTQARSAVAFPVRVPAALGDPTRVGVTADGRVLIMQWAAGSGQVELDQIAGAPAPYFVKKFYEDVEFTVVDGREALWLAQPHPIVVVAADGTELTRTARLSGPSLVWQNDGVTLRLEGVPDRDRAVAIAESLPT